MCERVGIYGGTFSPIHCGHKKAALAFLDAVPLDKLFIVPTSSAHKGAGNIKVSDAHRLEMARLAFSECPDRVGVSDFEIGCGQRRYTVDTLEYFAAPDRQLYMLVGTDMFLILDRWYRAEDIFSLADIVLMRREREDDNTVLVREKMSEYRQRYGARISMIDEEPTALSSTQIREQIQKGTLTRGLLPDGVEQYIRDNNLYR